MRQWGRLNTGRSISWRIWAASAAVLLGCGQGGNGAGETPALDAGLDAGHVEGNDANALDATSGGAGTDSALDSSDASLGDATLGDGPGAPFDGPPLSDGSEHGDAGLDASGGAPDDGPAVLSGSVQKGPFVLGSTVTLSAIDASGTATGT